MGTEEQEPSDDVAAATLEARVGRAWDALTQGQRTVVAHLVEQPAEAAFLGVRGIAEQLGVSTATVVRCAQTLGFSGYQELTTQLQDELLDRLGPKARFDSTISELDPDDEASPGKALETFMRRDVQNVEQTLELMDRQEFADAVDLIDGAKTVYLLATGLSTTPLEILSHRLPRVGLPTVFIDRPRPSALVPITDADLLVIASFRVPPEEELLRAARFSSRRGTPVLTVSGTPVSDLVQAADTHLLVRNGMPSHMASMTAPVAVANALALSVASRRRDIAAEYYALYEEVTGQAVTGGDEATPAQKQPSPSEGR